jgi:hypothetical protein
VLNQRATTGWTGWNKWLVGVNIKKAALMDVDELYVTK